MECHCSAPFLSLASPVFTIKSYLCPALKSSGCCVPASGSLSRPPSLYLKQAALVLPFNLGTSSLITVLFPLRLHVCPGPQPGDVLPSLSAYLETSQYLRFSLALSSGCGLSPGAHQGTWPALSKRGPSGWKRRFTWRGCVGPSLSCSPAFLVLTHTHTHSWHAHTPTHTHTTYAHTHIHTLTTHTYTWHTIHSTHMHTRTHTTHRLAHTWHTHTHTTHIHSRQAHIHT